MIIYLSSTYVKFILVAYSVFLKNERFCIRLFESFYIRTCSAYVLRDCKSTRFEIACKLLRHLWHFNVFTTRLATILEHTKQLGSVWVTHRPHDFLLVKQSTASYCLRMRSHVFECFWEWSNSSNLPTVGHCHRDMVSKQANKQTECALSLRHASDHTMAPFTLVSWMLVAKSKAIWMWMWMWTLKCELRSIQDRSKWVWTLSQSELRSISDRSNLDRS